MIKDDATADILDSVGNLEIMTLQLLTHYFRFGSIYGRSYCNKVPQKMILIIWCIKNKLALYDFLEKIEIITLFLEPKQFKNNLIMLEDKPQFEFAAS